jgi:N-acetylglutamate synthase-like GNAT family acetyltransferase
MKTGVTFRSARTSDIPALHTLIESAYRGETAKQGWTHEADLLGGQRTDQEQLAGILADQDQTILVADEDGQIIGCVAVRKIRTNRAYLGMLTVDPLLQSGGLGRRLIAAAEDHARNTFAASAMEMTVIVQRQELIAYYLRRGYHLTGETRPFPLDDPKFGLPTRRDLEFVVLEKAL